MYKSIKSVIHIFWNYIIPFITASDLNIESIIAQGQNVTIKSKNKVTVLLNSLADPYGCIIDVDEGLHNTHKVFLPCVKKPLHLIKI